MKLRQELTELRPSFRAMTACFTATSNVPWITLSAGYQGSQIVPPIRANSESLNGGRYMAANRNRAFSVLLLNCPTPLNATAYSLNITVVPHGSLDYLMVNGGINAFATDNTHLILDVTGYIAP